MVFADEDAIRLVHREGVVLLGGGRALLMQIAHPAVAAGVADHSQFRGDRLGRLLRTLRPTLAIVFGSLDQAQQAARHVNSVHAHVVGPGYRATDPALLAWVQATLIDSALLMYRRFVGPLAPATAAQYYEQMRSAATMLQMPGDALPSDLPAFRRYLGCMVASLEVSDQARAIARELWRPAAGATPLLLAARELTAGLLPPRLRAQYGMSWGRGREAALASAAALSRGGLHLLPPDLRAPPAALLPPGVRPAAPWPPRALLERLRSHV